MANPIFRGLIARAKVADVTAADHRELDLRGVECPLNWAHARVALDEMSPGQYLVLLLDDPKALRDIPLAAEAAGYAPLDAVEAPGYWRLAIEV